MEDSAIDIQQRTNPSTNKHFSWLIQSPYFVVLEETDGTIRFVVQTKLISNAQPLTEGLERGNSMRTAANSVLLPMHTSIRWIFSGWVNCLRKP